jgi:hypothetical protein
MIKMFVIPPSATWQLSEDGPIVSCLPLSGRLNVASATSFFDVIDWEMGELKAS